MPQFDIDGKGNLVQLTERQFLVAIMTLTGSYYGLAELCAANHGTGLGDFKGNFCGPTIVLIREQAQRLEQEIADKELQRAFHDLVIGILKLGEIDERIVQTQARLCGLSPLRDERDRLKLERRINRDRARFLSQAFPGELQALADESSRTFGQVQRMKRDIERRAHELGVTPTDLEPPAHAEVDPMDLPLHMRHLLRPRNWQPPMLEAQDIPEHTGPAEFGDQRAKDLIDEAAAEADLERAARLLRKALRYGRTGIQASKAYQGLGLIYDHSGQEARALQYYTKSIKVSLVGAPNPLTLFWRGRIYYRRKEWNKARADLETAVRLGLASPEQGEAEAYLREMKSSAADEPLDHLP